MATTDQPQTMSVVLSSDHYAWQGDQTDTLPYPQRHTYLETPEGWQRLCTPAMVLSALRWRMDGDRFEPCPDCQARAGQLNTDWSDARGQWAE